MQNKEEREKKSLMGKRKSQRVWVRVPQKVKFDATGKAKILKQVQEIISISDKLQQKVSRVDMRGNRVYLYELVEQFIPEDAILIKPLIDDKYLEYPYARITISNDAATSCTADWQRHNDQWMSLYSGTLQECLVHIENDDGWFG